MRGLLLVAALLWALSAPVARAQDGKLLDATPIVLKAADLAKLEAGEPGSRAALGQVELRSITYSSGGLKVKGYIALPKQGEKLPCVIYNRGGNREFGSLDDARAAKILGKLASWGYVAVASLYRGNGGGEGREEFGGKDVDDVLNLLPLLDALPRADATRVGMYGWSRGGMMTYLALARTDRIAAAVIGGGMADLDDMIRRRPEMESGVAAELVPRWATERDAAIAARSAVHWPEKLPAKTPLLLLHGTADWRVHPRQAMTMASKLLDLKRPFRLVLLEGGDHGLSEHRSEVDRLAHDWLDRYVRDRTSWPSLEPHGD
jgi:dipeptidyl aminopeptidase/acylaminoacyl peptidase